MEMHQVRYFLAVARILNFTRAAEECHVAQPSLTRAIKQLEHELGGELFRRERNLTHLSDLGQRMLPLIQNCYESALSAKTLATSIKAGAVVPLSIALARSVDIALVLPALTELFRVFPGTELRFMRGTAPEIAAHLKKGEADIAVAGSLGETWDRLDAWPIFKEPYRLVVSKAHSLASRTSVSPKDLNKERILTRTYCEQIEDVSSFLDSHDCNSPARHEVATEDDLLRLLETDLGVAISPLSAARSDKVKVVSIEGFDLIRAVHVYAVAGRQRSTAATTLIKMLRAANWSAYERPQELVNSAKTQ